MVRDGMVGSSNRPLRRQEKGKMEALCSASFVGAVHRRQSPASMRHPSPGRDRNGLKCRKSEIGIFSYSWPGSAHTPRMFTFLVAPGAAPWTRGAFPPIGVLSYGHY